MVFFTPHVFLFHPVEQAEALPTRDSVWLVPVVSVVRNVFLNFNVFKMH